MMRHSRFPHSPGATKELSHKHVVGLVVLQLDIMQSLHVLPIYRTIHIYMKFDLAMCAITPLIEGMMYLTGSCQWKT